MDLERSGEELVTIIIDESDEGNPDNCEIEKRIKTMPKLEEAEENFNAKRPSQNCKINPVSELLKTLHLSDSLEDLKKKLIKEKEQVLLEYGRDFSLHKQNNLSERILEPFLKYNFDQPYPPSPYDDLEDNRMSLRRIYVYPVETTFEVDERFEGEFTDRKIRNKFISKVFSIIFLQLLLTFIFIYFCVSVKQMKKFVREHFSLSLGFMILEVVVYLILVCCQSCRRKVPSNYILLAVFTVASAYVAAYLSVFYNTAVVLLAFGSTAAITGVVGLVAWSNWFDITTHGFILYIILMTTMIFSIVVGIHTAVTGHYTLYYILLYIMLVVVILVMLFNMQMIMGQGGLSLSTEEYIFAALTLFVAFMDLFSILLEILAGKR